MSEPLPVHLRDCAESPGHVWDQPNGLCMCPCHRPAFTFTVPGVVKGTNHGYHIVHYGGRCAIAKLPEIEAWQTEVAYRTRTARPKGWTPGRRIHIDYKVWFARAGRDADGIVKFLCDGIAAGLGVNDNAFLAAALLNEVDKVNPRVEVTIRNGS